MTEQVSVVRNKREKMWKQIKLKRRKKKAQEGERESDCRDNEDQLKETRMSWLLWPRSVPADDIQHYYEIVVFEVRHVCPQDVGLHFQLDILKREGTG